MGMIVLPVYFVLIIVSSLASVIFCRAIKFLILQLILIPFINVVLIFGTWWFLQS